jgi:hypothetical protein
MCETWRFTSESLDSAEPFCISSVSSGRHQWHDWHLSEMTGSIVGVNHEPILQRVAT